MRTIKYLRENLTAEPVGTTLCFKSQTRSGDPYWCTLMKRDGEVWYSHGGTESTESLAYIMTMDYYMGHLVTWWTY